MNNRACPVIQWHKSLAAVHFACVTVWVQLQAPAACRYM